MSFRRIEPAPISPYTINSFAGKMLVERARGVDDTRPEARCHGGKDRRLGAHNGHRCPQEFSRRKVELKADALICHRTAMRNLTGI